ncbi:transglycosylase SLT domain-containing protein [Chelativorans sp. Marseille-P2723]|uniref:transglycosylase SLT domain-containing protein n=1 Tax=Chelativorans sp. Marseille-P2723 TaxID=2709133 RepID=UPI00156EB204|nr:transglycosylase SLT domain-containing protein [Chelativorans sp. Marseille-P2723]
MRAVFLVLLLALAGCATTPGNINNVCSVFQQKNGWFNNWHRAAKRTERAYGVPVSILMATVRVESGFKANARPPRTKLLGFIPWKRASTAYGYSQALDGTWTDYRRETGRWGANRRNFADAIDFVGWYHRRSHERSGIALNDAYNLYLAYYAGHGGYARGVWKSNPGMQTAARRVAEMARSYDAQIQTCGL